MVRDLALILKLLLFPVVFFCNVNFVYPQTSSLVSENPSIQVKYTAEGITLDGNINEMVWQSILPVGRMHQTFPNDSLLATNDTEISMAYDDENLYVAITCHAQDGHFVTKSLRRDYNFRGSDNITLLFDTYSDQTNAYAFGINAFGVTRESTVSNSGQEGGDMDDSWDNKWYGASKILQDCWTVEMAIPFTTLRFNRGSQRWRFNLYRTDTQSNETSSWIDIPQNRIIMDLGFMGNMVWENPLKKSGRNISFIPYLSFTADRNFESLPENKTQTKLNAGGDLKLGISSGLNLDLTVNPDFSQVEVDEQVTNLDRFEILFPEKRQFFLENADLFGGFGGRFTNPFFSRRIGLNIDSKTGQNVQNTIYYGARLSGKLNKNLRIGLLNMQTASQDEIGLPGFNYSVATAEQKISEISRLAFIAVNKQALSDAEMPGTVYNSYNRLIGVEYRLNSKNNTWTGNSSFQKTITPGIDSDDLGHSAQFIYNTRKLRLEWAHVYVGNGYNPEVGFAPRKDFFFISPEASLEFYPKNSPVVNHTIGFDSRVYWKLGKDDNPYITDFAVEEINFEPFWSISFHNLSRLRLELTYNDLTLLEDFDPTRLQGKNVVLAAGSSHAYTEGNISYTSDENRRLTTEISMNGGSYFNGSRIGSSGNITYRYQPYGFISLDYTYNHIKLAEPFKPVNIWLIGPRIDLTFTKEIYFTTFIQYNNQLDNLNINARFQWRFAPVSDFFIVYTDNYDTSSMNNFVSRNRALVMKLTYWFNL